MIRWLLSLFGSPPYTRYRVRRWWRESSHASFFGGETRGKTECR